MGAPVPAARGGRSARRAPDLNLPPGGLLNLDGIGAADRQVLDWRFTALMLGHDTPSLCLALLHKPMGEFGSEGIGFTVGTDEVLQGEVDAL